MKSLKIGLVKREYGWERILEQEKVLWEIVNFSKDLSVYSLLILNSNKISEIEINNIKSYLSNGGALLTDTLSFNLINKTRKISKIYIKNIIGRGNLFRNIDKINIESWGLRLKNFNCGLINGRFSAIYASKFGKGFVIVLPFNLNLLMLDERFKKLYLPSPYTLLKENISVVSKGDLRRLIVNCFHYLYLIRRIPYLHIWYYPNNSETVFSYRLDLDIFNKKEIDNILQIIKNDKINFTWFLSVINNKNYENEIKILHSLSQDIQSHSYEHIIYDSFDKNYNNILESNKFISKISNVPIGFAAPFGYWNKSLGKALEKLNYLYSSEFSLSYDDLPFYPFLYNNKSKVIQLPIYPSCISLLRMYLYSKNRIKNYFNYLINMQYKRQMPLFLYDHPNEGVGVYPEILDFVLKKVKGLDNIIITNLTEFAKWWKKREKIKFNVYINKNKLKIETNNKNKEFYIRIILPNYKEIRLPLNNQSLDINKLNGKSIPIFKDEKVRNIDILKSKILFSIFYIGILFKSIKKRLYNIFSRL